MGHDSATLLKMVERDSCSMILPGFGEAVTSNHLDVSSVWKLLVANCLFVAIVQMRIFNALVSSTKVFISRAKHICPHTASQVFVSSTKHAFVSSTKHVNCL